jgi:hypothetical protein
MANTNLYRSDQLPGANQKKGNSVDKGMVFSGALLILVFALYGGVSWYNSFLDGKKSETDQKIATASELLKSPDASQVADFQRRLDKIEESLANKKNPTEILDLIEKTIVPEAVVKSFTADYNKGILEIVMNVDNFRSMAKQILIFKQQNLADNLNFTEVTRDDDGRIDFLVSGDLKGNKSDTGNQTVQ